MGEDFSDGVSSNTGKYRIGVPVVGQGDQSNGQDPTATSLPRRVIDRQSRAEDVPCWGGEKIPCNDQVTGRIAHAHPPKSMTALNWP